MMKTAAIVAAFALLFALSGPAAAACDHPGVRWSLVKVTAEGESKKDFQKVRTKGTGFVVSASGRVLTSRHLMTRLGDVTNLKFFIDSDLLGIDERDGDIDWEDARHDLLIIKISGEGVLLPFLSAPDPERVPSSDVTICTSGFPENGYFVDHGKIHGDGPAGHRYLWNTSLTVREGQSGSPVYLEDKSVIGIVKATEAGFPPTLSFVVPAVYFPQNLMDEAPKVPPTKRDDDLLPGINPNVSTQEVSQLNLESFFTGLVRQPPALINLEAQFSAFAVEGDPQGSELALTAPPPDIPPPSSSDLAGSAGRTPVYSLATTQAVTTGWSYFGATDDSGKKWAERYFNIADGDANRMPRAGDRLIAAGMINVREREIRWNGRKWDNNGLILRTLQKGQEALALDVIEVYPGFHWVKLKIE